MKLRSLFVSVGLFAVTALIVPASTSRNESPDTVVIPAGNYQELYRGKNQPEQQPIPAFRLARVPVTNAEFLVFVRSHPEWQRTKAGPLFVDSNYLVLWTSDLELGPKAPPNSPVVNVSWFAARAYAHSLGARLPLTAEWERAAGVGFTRKDFNADPVFINYTLNWLGRPTPDVLPAVGSTPANFYGVKDLQGLVWEWVEDFNTALLSDDGQGDGSQERNLFCGAGAIGAKDRGNYPAFVRTAFRSSLRANYCVGSLGFRCVYSR